MLKQALEIAVEKSTVATALKLTVVVGIALNLINQSAAILDLDWKSLDMPRMLLTFMVPYLVSTFSTIKAKLPVHEG